MKFLGCVTGALLSLALHLLCARADTSVLPNLAINPNMENWSSGATVAANWASFNYRTIGSPSNNPQFFKSTNDRRDGLAAQGINLVNIPTYSVAGAFTRCGIYQQVSATPGKVYTLIVWALMKTSKTSQAYSYEIGIDPNGGTNPEAAYWSDAAWNHFDRVRGIWNMVEFSAKAQSNTITIFLRASVMENTSRSGTNQVFFDIAGLFEADQSLNASLVNGGFEDGFDTLSGFENPPGNDGLPLPNMSDPAIPASGWSLWGSSHGYTDAYDANWDKTQIGAYVCEGKAQYGQTHEGSRSLRLMNNKGTCNWGAYQRIAATPGQIYTVTGWTIGTINSTQSLGLDPNGGIDPNSSAIEWLTTPGTNTSWAKLGVMKQAAANAVTVFLKSVGPNKAGSNDAKFDEIVFTQGATLPAPSTTITSPASGTAISGVPQVSVVWDGDSRSASQVRVCVGTEPDTNSIYDSGQINGTGTSLLVSGLPSSGVYYIFARMKNSAGWGAWSPAVQIRVNVSPPNPPVITSPASGTVSTSSQYVNVTWTGDSHDYYETRVCSVNDPSNPDYWASGQVASTGFTCQAGPLPRQTTCYIFVRLRNGVGWGDWSSGCLYQTNVGLKILPEPQETALIFGQSFPVSQASAIILPPGASDDDLFTAKQIYKRIYTHTDMRIPIKTYKQGMSLDKAIAIGTIDGSMTSNNPAVTTLISNHPSFASKEVKLQGSLIAITNNYIVIGGFDSDGQFYACQSLIQLLDMTLGQSIPGMTIYDFPDLKRRGVLLRWWGLYGSYDPAFAEEVMSEVVARYKMNTIQLEIRQGMFYDTAPNLNYVPSTTTKAETKAMVDMMRRYHIETIAGGVSSTHADQWLTDRYPQFGIPGHLSDLDFLNEAGKQFIKNLIDEQIEVCSPSIVHVGGDEGAVGPEVVLNWTNYLREYLATKGIRIAIWGDMIENYGLTGSLADDIIVQDWDYNSSKTDYTSLNTWTQNGLASWVAPYGVYVTNNVPGPYNIYYSGISARNYGSEGMVAFNKAILGEKNQTILSQNTTLPNTYALDNYAQYPFYAEWSWTTGRPLNNPLPFDGKEMFLRQLSPDRPQQASAELLGSRDVVIAWKTPINPNTFGIRIVYRYDRYPEDIEDGNTLCKIVTPSDTPGRFTHTNVASGGTVYYSIFAYDRLSHYSPPTRVQVQTGNPMSLGVAKLTPDGQTVLLPQMVVTAVFSGEFYLEAADRSCGTGVVSSASVNVGDMAQVAGRFGVIDGERKLSADWVNIVSSGNAPPNPLTMQNKTVSCGECQSQRPVWSWVWVEKLPGTYEMEYQPANCLNNIGLLIRVFGAVTQIDPNGNYFYVDDGSGLLDDTTTEGTPNQGVRIAFDGRSYQPGQFVFVTGICSCALSPADKPIRLVRPRWTTDFQLITQ